MPEAAGHLAVVQALLAIPGLVPRPEHPESEWQGVASIEQAAAVQAVLCEALGQPAKPGGARTPIRLWWDPVARAVGGVRREQTLWIRRAAGAETVYAAIWPWASDPKRFTIKVGVHGG